MNKPLRFLLPLLVGVLSTSNVAQAQLVGLSVEVVADHDTTGIASLAGMKTYRVYADFTNTTDKVSAIYGDETAPLSLISSDGFFNSTFGDDLAQGVNALFFSAFPEAEYDSWITIGYAPGDPILGNVGTVGLNDPLETFNNGGDLILDDQFGGSWFVTTDPNAVAGDDLQVLLAQLTTSGTFQGSFNVQAFIEGNQANEQQAEGFLFSSDPEAILGCMDESAENYNPDATAEAPCIYPCALELSVGSLTSISCPGLSDGEITLAQTGGQFGVTYGIDGAAPLVTNPNFDDLPAGAHYIVGIDGAGCIDTLEFEVVMPAPIAVSAVLESGVSCNGVADAVIGGTATGGTGVLSFSLNDNTFSNITQSLEFTSLSSGNYTVYAMDENGCTASSPSIFIYNPAVINVYVTNATSASCFDSDDGAIVVTTVGGSPGSTGFQYSVDQVNYSAGTTSNGTVLNVGAGEYTVYVVDANNCVGQSSSPVTVEAPTEISFESQIVAVYCDSAAIAVEGAGGVSPFELVIDGVSMASGIPENDPVQVSVFDSGLLELQFVDANGCEANSTISIPDFPGDADGDGVCNGDEVPGCQYPNACNFNPDATEDDGSCIFYCPGCTDPAACNFDSSAIQSDGSCVYPLDLFGIAYLDCSGECLSDNDEDGVCDEEEIGGCMDEVACNYDPLATDQLVECIYPALGADCNGVCLLDSDGDGVCDVADDCPFDALNDEDGDGVCADQEVYGCTDSGACNFDPVATEPDGSCSYPASLFTDCAGDCLNDSDGDGVCDELEVQGCQASGACNYDASATDSDGSCEYVSCAGCIYVFACNYDPTATISDLSCEFGTCAGCTDPMACNFNPTLLEDDGSCVYPDGCGICNGDSPSFTDCDGNCINDSDGDGVCDELEIVGCIDDSACNYAPLATDEGEDCSYPLAGYDCTGECLADADGDGVCDFLEQFGCMDELACNFDVDATDDDGSCLFATGCDFCSGESNGSGYVVDGDSDDDGVCDEQTDSGCTYSEACNFNVYASSDDGSCIFPLQGQDCDGNCLVDLNANGVCDFDELTDVVDDLQSGAYCAEGTVWNADLGQCVASYCFGDFNVDGGINGPDLLYFLSRYDTPCELGGCTDAEATNFNQSADYDDGSCVY